jgi:DNA (cytosine-5)-methyltransferase 1
MEKPKVISLFSGAMGLDLGFEAGGFEIRVANDIDQYAVATVKKNRPDIPIINHDIRQVSTSEILDKAGLRAGEADVVIGGPPCQPFSTAGKRLSIQDPQGSLFLQFVRVIEESRPHFFMMENVKGLVSAALKHVGFYERINNKRKLAPEEKLGSAFEFVIKRFKQTNYSINWDVLNAADYGVPQKRVRLFIIGAREPPRVPLPERTHALRPTMTVNGKMLEGWRTLRDAFKDLDDPRPEFSPFPSWGKFLKYVPPGGSWVNIPHNLQKEAMGGAHRSQGGRRGFYRRLSWDEPCPTLVTSPIMKATCLCHPDEDRPLSVREYSRIQQFPDNWEFVGPTSAKYRQIGEAVPVGLSQAVSKMIKLRLAGK